MNQPINKVFVIGLPRTGTKSLHTVLSQLGYRSHHHPGEFRFLQLNGEFQFPGQWDALCGFGVGIYPQLDENYPNSRFILTMRNKDDWLKSMKWKHGRRPDTRIGSQTRIDIFGCQRFNAQRYSYVFDQHYKNVVGYFSNMQEKLLILDIGGRGNMDKLCAFLEKESLALDFPITNTRGELEKRSFRVLFTKKVRMIIADFRFLLKERRYDRRKKKAN